MTEFAVRCVLDAKAELGECPLWSIDEQRLFWIDIMGHKFHSFDPLSGRDESWDLPEPPGSFVLAACGGVVLAMQSGFYHFDPKVGLASYHKVADAPYDTGRYRFNDGRTDKQGRYWVGSMLLDMMEHGEASGAYYSFDGESITHRLAGVDHANGTAFTLDGSRLYRAETMKRAIYSYAIDPVTGALSDEQLFASIPENLGLPDGAAVDTQGGYWSALPAGPNGGNIARFKPDGTLDRVIEMPVAIVTMPAFGGPDMSTLYVTSGRLEAMIGQQPTAQSGGLFAIDVPYQGQPEVPFKGF